MTVADALAHVVTGGDFIGTQHLGILQEDLELDLPVTKDVRIRRTACFVLCQEVLEYVVPILGSEVSRVQLDAQFGAHGFRIGQILLRRAVFGAVVFIPVFHKQALDLVPLLEQKESRNGGVDAAGHADNHFAGGSGVGV